MLKIHKLTSEKDFEKYGITRKDFVDFLYEHLDQFGDKWEYIDKCLDYALSDNEYAGGYMILAFDDDKLIGEVLMNRTGMVGYIPEYVLVYIAVHRDARGKGFGGKIMKKAFEWSEGDVKLHVEYDNPAKRLYERVGMTNKYAEMRYIKDEG